MSFKLSRRFYDLNQPVISISISTVRILLILTLLIINYYLWHVSVFSSLLECKNSSNVSDVAIKKIDDFEWRLLQCCWDLVRNLPMIILWFFFLFHSIPYLLFFPLVICSYVIFIYDFFSGMFHNRSRIFSRISKLHFRRIGSLLLIWHEYKM